MDKEEKRQQHTDSLESTGSNVNEQPVLEGGTGQLPIPPRSLMEGAPPVTREAAPREEAEPAGVSPEHPVKNSWQFTPKKGYILCGVALLLAAIAVLAGLFSAPSVRIEALDTAAGSSDIAPDTAFRISVRRGNLTLEEMREMVVTEPEVPFALAEAEKGVFVLSLRQVLEVNSPFSISVGKTTSRFRVADMLVVLSHFPAKDGTQVPLSSGVELKFNKEVDLGDLGEAFSISPRISGSFAEGDGRYVFYPDEPMDSGATYQVELDRELVAADGAPLSRPLRFSFTSVSKEEEDMRSAFWISSASVSTNVLTAETPLLRAYIDNEIARGSITVDATVYQLGTWQEYYEVLWDNTQGTGRTLADSLVDTTGYEAFTNFQLEPIPASEENNGSWLLQFPDTLPEGWYVAEFTMTLGGVPVTRQAFLQVSDLSVFSMTMDQYMLVWVNDAMTGQPVEKARVEVAGAYRMKGETNADGLLYVEEGEPAIEQAAGYSTLFTVTDGERTFVGLDYYYSQYNLYEESVVANRYISYLFTDRPIYRTTDTIEVWGVYRPRLDGVPQPTEAKLVLGNETIEEQVVPVGPDGTFRATIAYENATAGWNGLNLYTADGVYLQYLGLEIQDFEKPIYTATSTTDKPVYMVGYDDAIDVIINISMFDGTPASKFGLDFWAYGFQSSMGDQLVTDAAGQAKTALSYHGERENTWYPQYSSYGGSSTDPQQEYFYTGGSFYLIHRDLMLKGKTTFTGNSAQMEVTTNRIAVDGIETVADLWKEDALKGAEVSTEVTAELHHIYNEKVQTGVSYDYITRTSYKVYDYVRHDDVEWVDTFQTTGGSYLLENLPVSGDRDSYYILLTATDSLGRTVESKAYIGSEYYYRTYYNDNTTRYGFRKVLDPNDLREVWEGGDVYYSGNRTSFRGGEEVAFELLANDAVVEELAGRVLYTVVQDGFAHTGVTAEPRLQLGFTEDLVPNYVLMGAYFDGKRAYILEDLYMFFDESSRKLEVELEPDKQVYAPGGEIRVTATVTDANTGHAVEGSTIVLSVVDEAVFAIHEQYIDILSDIYRSIYYPNVRKYTSHMPLDPPSGAEKGGGGGEDIRTDFVDTAHFAVAATQAGGKASFSFRLPDNITSWRLTSLALTGDNRAGSVRTNVRSTLDYYVLPIVNERLLSGDSLAVGLYSAGAGVRDDDEVAYTVTLTGNGMDEKMAQTSTVRGFASVDFGPVSSGEYTVLIEGTSGGYRDAVQLPVEVVPSGIEVATVRTFRLSDGISIDPLRYPVSISFYSESARTYNLVMRSMLERNYGLRVDARIARASIARMRAAQGEEWYDTEALEDNLRDIGSRRVLSVFPHSNYDLEFTVKAYLAAPELVGDSRLRQDILEETRQYYDNVENWSDAAVCLAEALTGAEKRTHDPLVLLQEGSLDYVDQVYLAMALAASGEEHIAREWYGTLVTDRLSPLTGVSGQQVCYIQAPDARRSDHDCTAAAALFATMLETGDEVSLLGYLVEKPSLYEPYILEKLYYLNKNADAAGSSSAKMSYTRSSETVTLDLARTRTVSFNKQQLQEADFQGISGDVYADVYYYGAPEVLDSAQNILQITKTVEAVDGSFEPGALVKITIAPSYDGLDTSLGDSYLVVEDYIPSGMRFALSDSNGYGNGWYFRSRQGQRVSFTIYDPAKTPRIVYYARCSTPGSYIVESAYISSGSGAAWGASQRDTVIIEGAEPVQEEIAEEDAVE